MDRDIDGWMDRGTDGWMDILTDPHMHIDSTQHTQNVVLISIDLGLTAP